MSGLFLLLGLIALLVCLLLRRRAKVLPGEVVYRDTPEAPTLVSHQYRAAGRPDYVARTTHGLVPVEVKSRACGRGGPYPSERTQVLTYCLIVEEEFGEKVLHGELQYPDLTIIVPFGDRQRQEITELLGQMDATQEAHRSHGQPARCRKCGFRGQCSEALA